MGRYFLGLVSGFILTVLIIWPTGVLNTAAGAAVVVAVAALSLASWQGIETRRHYRLLAKPHCSLSVYNVRVGDRWHFKLELGNAGPGVAYVKSLVANFNDQELTVTKGEAWLEMFGDTIDWEGKGVNPDGVYLEPQSTITLFEAKFPEAGAQVPAGLTLTADIWSIYGQKIPHKSWKLE